jgi:transposase InsO family protein
MHVAVCASAGLVLRVHAGAELVGGSFSAPFDAYLETRKIVHHRTPPRSPNYNAVCERFQDTALQECWRPAFHLRHFDHIGQLRTEIDTWLVDYNTRRENHSDYRAFWRA